MNKRTLSLAAFCFFIGLKAQAQVDPAIVNWYNGTKVGMHTEKGYAILKDRKSEQVVVAIIDSGMDIEHEDLQGKMWVNSDEIPNNGIDDDKNGYIDDVNGWNFLGGKNGANVNDARLELARIVAEGNKKYGDSDGSDLSGDEKAKYDEYVALKNKLDEERTSAEQELAGVKQFKQQLGPIQMMIGQAIGKNDYTLEDVKKWKATPEQAQLKQIGIMLKSGQLTEADLDDAIKHYEDQMASNLNPDFDDRSIIGDRPNDFSDKYYGNSDAEGPDALHGTHVGGIVGSIRGNNLGGDGVAENVKLMSIRAVPNGDEHDKDIAMAVRYAVDNGAQVINMSFGKAYSPHAKEVFEAFKYADSKGVLLVHAAGNSAEDIDVEPNFPTSKYEFQTQKLDHFLTIGASTRYKKAKGGNSLAASFSNYGDEGVDVFAPGYEIYNAVPQSDYKKLQGTSMAAPMVAGVAAMLKSYFPTMSMKEIKEVILLTAKDHSKRMVYKPGSQEKIAFGELSVTGGVVNVKAAVKECLKREKAKG